MKAAANSELIRVAALRQGIRLIVSSAFRVNTMGLNAILLAKRFGEQAKGFGVISGELRSFSKSLGQSMQQLSEDSAELVSVATHQLKLKRRLQLLQTAADARAHAGLASACGRAQDDDAAMSLRLLQLRQRMQERIDDAYQSCLFGTVIARSARIEAAYAGSSGLALTEASFEFARQVDQVLPSLELLQRAVKG